MKPNPVVHLELHTGDLAARSMRASAAGGRSRSAPAVAATGTGAGSSSATRRRPRGSPTSPCATSPPPPSGPRRSAPPSCSIRARGRPAGAASSARRGRRARPLATQAMSFVPTPAYFNTPPDRSQPLDRSLRPVRGDADDRPRRHRRERRPSCDPERSRLLPVQPRLGGQRLPDRVRRPAAARRPDRRPARPQERVPRRPGRVRRRLAAVRRWRRARRCSSSPASSRASAARSPPP